MRYSELIENTDSDDDLFAKPLADRIRARLAELEDQDMMEPDDMIDTVAEEFNLEVEQVYDLLDDEVYENTDDDDLFGESTPKKVFAYLVDYARRMQQDPADWSQYDSDDAGYDQDVEEINRQAHQLADVAKVFAQQGMSAGIQAFNDGSVENGDWWWDRIATEMAEDIDIDLEDHADNVNETDDDDDMFATPKIAFNDVFNEYDEDQLMAQGFQYGDHPEQDIEILNNYLEDYKDFRVVDISGGEHDLILHLDRSSRLRETDDDLFGTTSFNADRAGKLIATANITSGELVDPESIQHALEHAANRVMNSPVVQKKAADQLQKWMAMDNDAQWELVDEIANVVYDINGDGWEPEEDPYYDRANESTDDDDELFGVSRSNAVKIGHLLAAAGVTGFDLWEPDTVEDGLKLAKKLPGQGRSADELLQLWKQLDDDDDQWNEYQIIRKIVIDINGDGLLDPEEDPDYDRANEDGHAL
jgi:hypothetical protein